MNVPSAEFRVVRIDPVDCLRQSWAVVKPRYWQLFGILGVGLLLGSMGPMGILMGPMMCGIYLCLFRLLRGEPMDFAMLFKGFDYFVQSFIATLIITGIAMVFLIPLYAVFFGAILAVPVLGKDGGGAAALAAGLFSVVFVLVLVLMSLLMGLLFLFTYPLIVDRGMRGVDALKTSARAAWANLGGVIGLVLLNFLLSMAGMFACCVGSLLVMPVSFGAYAIAFRKVFPELPAPVLSPAA